MQKNDSPAIFRFILMYSLFLVFGAWVVVSWSNGILWQIIASLVLFGTINCSLFACQHETVHSTAFKSRRLNKIAAFLCGIGHIYPPTIFKGLHYTHHRHTHIPGLDPEISFAGKPMPSVISNLPSYLAWLSGFPLLLFKILMVIMGCIGMPESIRKWIYPFLRSSTRRAVVFEAWVIMLTYISLLLLAIYVNSGFWGIFIGQIVGHCLLASYLVPEHNGLPHEGDILEKTRSINTNILVKLLMWNMPYHAEHHAYPAVPFHALPNLHKAMQADLIHTETSHANMHFKVFKHTFTKSEFGKKS
ncbi:MAG: hypothetical protein GY810_06370 [Aureispira sp.]|nr:hypothetical protein [Aureispira sp.]